MIDPDSFIKHLISLNVNFFTGVPDSLLKNLLKSIYSFKELGTIQHVVTPNEGLAVSLAAGSYIGTRNIPLVYLQNSGLGNAVNPLTSLTHTKVFAIPMLIVIGWRGEEGKKDEPQHEVMGMITRELLDLMEIQYFIIDKSADYKSVLNRAVTIAQRENGPVALLVRSNSFESKEHKFKENSYDIKPKVAIEKILDSISEDSLVFSTTGKLSRQVYQFKERRSSSKVREFLSVGSMGHILSTSIGYALSNTKKRVFVLDGDGSAIMHLGSFLIWEEHFHQLENFCYILFINDSHDSVGGQPLSGGSSLALNKIIQTLVPTLNQDDVLEIKTIQDLSEINFSSRTSTPKFVVIRVARNSGELPRPSERPSHYLKKLMDYIHNE